MTVTFPTMTLTDRKHMDDLLLHQANHDEKCSDADGDHAQLRIVDIPDDVNWYIDDYDGIETVREHHRTW